MRSMTMKTKKHIDLVMIRVLVKKVKIAFFFDPYLMNLKAKKNSQLLSMNYRNSFP